MKRPDDFSPQTRRLVAHRAGNRCSNPNCRKQTSGPSTKTDSYIDTGIASHITAAQPGGKRYDAVMSSTERKSISNAIWLCATCAKIIDSDEVLHTVERLQTWKSQAEASAQKEQIQPASFADYSDYSAIPGLLEFLEYLITFIKEERRSNLTIQRFLIWLAELALVW